MTSRKQVKAQIAQLDKILHRLNTQINNDKYDLQQRLQNNTLLLGALLGSAFYIGWHGSHNPNKMKHLRHLMQLTRLAFIKGVSFV